MRAVGTANAWFEFKGIRNTAFDVQMLSMPTRPHPARKGELVSIPGRDGKLFLDEGVYDRILVSLRCIACDNANIDAVNAWLSGEGDLVFGDEPDRAYHARITKEFSRSNRSPRLRGQEFTISFDCEPYRYQSNPVSSITVASDSSINNPGSVASAPLINVYLKKNIMGAGELMIGDNSLIFTDNVAASGSRRIITVDCDAKICYGRLEGVYGVDTTTLANHVVQGDWVRIQPGDNTVTFAGDIEEVRIVPRWRWL